MITNLECLVPQRAHERGLSELSRRLASSARLPGARRPFLPKLLDHLLASEPEKFSECELATGRFLLWVWDHQATWRSGRFEPEQALAVWDAEHRAVYARWLADPSATREATPHSFQAEVFPLR